jgi:hypothetical protein
MILHLQAGTVKIPANDHFDVHKDTGVGFRVAIVDTQSVRHLLSGRDVAFAIHHARRDLFRRVGSPIDDIKPLLP